jgi:hypothetical protein
VTESKKLVPFQLALQYFAPPAIAGEAAPNVEVRMAKRPETLDELYCF